MGTRKLFNPLLKTFGYELVRSKKGVSRNASNASFVLYDYRNPDGRFDYDTYLKIQTGGNKKKIDKVWAQEDNIKFIADYILSRTPNPAFGICHGTRRGLEQKWFGTHLGCDVVGTEISDTADQFENTIKWDFHDANPDWLDKADFVYSNSLDHAYDPEKALGAWMASLKPGGLCFIEHSRSHEPEAATALDPFGVHLEMLPYLVTRWGKGRYGVRRILDLPAASPGVTSKPHAVVVERFSKPDAP